MGSCRSTCAEPASALPLTSLDAVRLLLGAQGIPARQLPDPAEAQLGLYHSMLAGKRMLIILDNARDAAQIRPLLPGSPTCRVIVTSRNQLPGLHRDPGRPPADRAHAD